MKRLCILPVSLLRIQCYIIMGHSVRFTSLCVCCLLTPCSSSYYGFVAYFEVRELLFSLFLFFACLFAQDNFCSLEFFKIPYELNFFFQFCLECHQQFGEDCIEYGVYFK